VADQQNTAREIITRFLDRANKRHDTLTAQTRLYGDGLELDSLEAAELSALLEDEFGTDPFTAGDTMPETIGDILTFYAIPSEV
jgi:acyl carrier protein